MYRVGKKGPIYHVSIFKRRAGEPQVCIAEQHYTQKDLYPFWTDT